MTWYAQAGQDVWVADELGHSRGGYFVDIGAYDGIEHSNSYALETTYGWTGCCIEPNVDAFTLLARRRTSVNMFGAVKDYTGTCHLVGDRTAPAGGIEVPCFRLSDILSRVGAPRVIDYLSIDVEGAEMEVLGGLDASYDVRLITIEHNLYCDGPERKEQIFDELTSRGFERVVEDIVAPGYGAYEDWYRNSASSFV